MTRKIQLALLGCFLYAFLGLELEYSMPDNPVPQKEVVDRIVALVNEKVITLTDVKIVRAFHLFSSEGKSDVDIDIQNVLKKLIDQNLVIQMTQENTYRQNGRVDEFLDQIIAEMGVEQFRKQLKQFGMTRQDLMPYASDWITYQRIIADRFNTSIPISLKEIEEHYEQTYVPTQKAEDREVKPMLEILDEIETVIKREKSKMQVEEWQKNLRERADIQINL